MNCKETRELMSALIDNELTMSEKEAVLSHIAECESCRREYQELSEIKKQFSKLDYDLGGKLAESVIAKIYEAEKPRKKKPFIFKYMGTAAAVTVIVALFAYTRLAPMPDYEKSSAPETATDTKNEAVQEKNDINFAYSKDTVVTESYKDDSEALEEERLPTETATAPMPVKPESSDGIKSEIAEEFVYPSDFRAYNSIPNDSAIIYTDSDLEALLPLFDSKIYIADSYFNVSSEYDEVIDILASNSITVKGSDVPAVPSDVIIVAQ